MDQMSCLFFCLFTCVQAVAIAPNLSYTLVRDKEINRRYAGVCTYSTNSDVYKAVNAVFCSRLCEQASDCFGFNVCVESGVTACDLVPSNMRPLDIGQLKLRPGCSYFHKVNAISVLSHNEGKYAVGQKRTAKTHRSVCVSAQSD